MLILIKCSYIFNSIDTDQATDLVGRGESNEMKADFDPFLTPELGELMKDSYL
ncbi:MAG: hypothetical protein R6U96_10095 [Promethearchaeia archaeon]